MEIKRWTNLVIEAQDKLRQKKLDIKRCNKQQRRAEKKDVSIQQKGGTVWKVKHINYKQMTGSRSLRLIYIVLAALPSRTWKSACTDVHPSPERGKLEARKVADLKQWCKHTIRLTCWSMQCLAPKHLWVERVQLLYYHISLDSIVKKDLSISE